MNELFIKSGNNIPKHLCNFNILNITSRAHSLARIPADVQYFPRGLIDNKFSPRGFNHVQFLYGRLTSHVKYMHSKYWKTDNIDEME